MPKIRSLSQRYAIPFTIGFFFAYILLRLVLGGLFGLFPDGIVMSYCSELIDLIVPVILLVVCGYGFALRTEGFGKGLKAGMAVFLFYLCILLLTVLSAAFSEESQWPKAPVILLGILSMIGIGIREETIFRGLLGNTLVLKYGKNGKGLFGAVLLSSFLFGAVHLMNFFAGVKLPGLIPQVLQATSLGALFTAIYLRGGNLWVVVLIHAIIDASGLFASTFLVSSLSVVDEISSLSYSGLIMLPIEIALAMFLLRKSKRTAIFARLEALRGELDI